MKLRTSLLFVILGCLLVIASFAAEEAAQTTAGNAAENTAQNTPQAGENPESVFSTEDAHSEEEAAGAPPGKPNEEAQEQMRSILISCIVLSKHKIYGNQKELNSILEQYGKDQKKQNAVYRRLMADLLSSCHSSSNYLESQKIVEDLQKKDFNVANYEHVFGTFKWEKYGDANLETNLSQYEESLIKFAEEFDKAMRDKQAQEAPEEEEPYKYKPEDFEPKIGGFSFKDVPSLARYGYVLGVLAIFGGIMFLGAHYLLSEKKTTLKKKVKKEKKKE